VSFTKMRRHIAVRLEIGSCWAGALRQLACLVQLTRSKILFDLFLNLEDNLRPYGKLGMA
jgi:hypothetical protein